MIVEMGPEWLTQVLPGGLRATWGGSGWLWILMGKQCDKHIGITPLIGGISHLYPTYIQL